MEKDSDCKWNRFNIWSLCYIICSESIFGLPQKYIRTILYGQATCLNWKCWKKKYLEKSFLFMRHTGGMIQKNKNSLPCKLFEKGDFTSGGKQVYKIWLSSVAFFCKNWKVHTDNRLLSEVIGPSQSLLFCCSESYRASCMRSCELRPVLTQQWECSHEIRDVCVPALVCWSVQSPQPRNLLTRALPRAMQVEWDG